MNGLKTIQIIHAGDADQHLGHLGVICERLQTEKRITGYSRMSSTTVGTTSFSGLGEGDMVIMLLSDGMESKRASLERSLFDASSRQPLLKVVEILVDQVVFNPRFIVLPIDLRPIRLRRDMDATWFQIGRELGNYFPTIQEPIPS
ncbi:MAG TPA: hypothetical protein VFM69_10640, partial [Pricia sp.]|nr:hypothetical protein [Pricia sp.]